MVWHSASEKEARGAYLIERDLERASDRGVALLVGALLEYRLALILETKGNWRGSINPSKRILRESFADKIKAAFNDGYISAEAREDFKIIKKIRNRFAHEWEGVEDFQSGEIKQLSLSLSVIDKALGENPLPGHAGERLLLVHSDHGTAGIGHLALEADLRDARGRFVWTARLFMTAPGMKKGAGPFI